MLSEIAKAHIGATTTHLAESVEQRVAEHKAVGPSADELAAMTARVLAIAQEEGLAIDLRVLGSRDDEVHDRCTRLHRHVDRYLLVAEWTVGHPPEEMHLEETFGDEVTDDYLRRIVGHVWFTVAHTATGHPVAAALMTPIHLHPRCAEIPTAVNDAGD